MKRLMNFQLKCNYKINAISVIITVFFMSNPVYAQVAGLENAGKVLKALEKDLIEKIIPVAAAVILLCLAIGYAGRYIEKDTFVRWAIGVVIAGSASQIALMLFKP
ncbi:VirB2 family type IV secretion system major pilin TrwL [Bartonella saheliensis]|uniref:VirB2 family type IV secretion system major pilin TrwL n=1 Tax=Bartonella saheliensis TaxID=1457016 RepID=UPI0011A6F6D6|nr:VirB2 family type IV secretion system major pilin TrwL [Bartonella saheliensis]